MIIPLNVNPNLGAYPSLGANLNALIWGGALVLPVTVLYYFKTTLQLFQVFKKLFPIPLLFWHI